MKATHPPLKRLENLRASILSFLRGAGEAIVFALSMLLRNGIRKMNVTSEETRAQGGEIRAVDPG